MIILTISMLPPLFHLVPPDRFFIKFATTPKTFFLAAPDSGTLNKKPRSFVEWKRSRTTLTTASNGIDKNIPCIPHNAAPAMTAISDARAFSLTFEPTTAGTNIIIINKLNQTINKNNIQCVNRLLCRKCNGGHKQTS
jgi:hypothetical protein